MRILLASESFYPVVSGVSVVTQRLAAVLAERGHEVAVAAPSLDRRFHREKRDGYVVYRLPSRPNPFKKGSRFAPFSYRHVRRVFDEVKPEVVHIQEPATLCRTVARKARRSGIAVVATQHFTFEYLMTFLPLLKTWHPIIQTVTERNIISFYNQCTVLTAPTHTLKRYLDRRKLKVPITVISNGVDVSRFTLRQRSVALLKKYRIPADRPLIGYVGRIDNEKNLEVMLEAVALLKQEGKPFHLVVVGHGLWSRQIHAHARRLGLAGHIRWIKPISNQDKLFPQVFNLLDIFCIPSPIETESMVTMEAMASGLPVVAANGGALPELIANDKNGYLVSPDQPEEWAEALRGLLADPILRKKMGEEGRRRIMSRDFFETIRHLEGLYAQAAATNSAHHAEPDL